jgi:inner membrane protein
MASRGEGRQVSLGLSFGVALHLFRDLATGPGASLFWPLTGTVVTVPYAVYATALALAVAAVAASAVTARRDSDRASPARRRPPARPLPNAYPPGGF